MKLLSTIITLGLLPLALATSVLITYPKDTPDSVIEQAKDSIRDAGGIITHEYSVVVKGFSAEAPESAIEQVSVQSEMYKPRIEKDSTVSIQ